MRAGEGGAFWRNEANETPQSSPRKRGPMITRRSLWVPALAALGRDDDVEASKEPTCGCRKVAPRTAPCFRPVLYRELRNSSVCGYFFVFAARRFFGGGLYTMPSSFMPSGSVK